MISFTITSCKQKNPNLSEDRTLRTQIDNLCSTLFDPAFSGGFRGSQAHARFDDQGSQGASQHQTIKTTQVPNAIFLTLLYKFIRGVLLGVVGAVLTSNVYRKKWRHFHTLLTLHLWLWLCRAAISATAVNLDLSFEATHFIN